MHSDSLEVFLFLHVPKTGGSSLVRLFEQSLDLGSELIRLDNPALDLDRRAGRPPFAKRSAEDRAKARIVVGHDVHVDMFRLIPGRVPRYLTFLRAPAPRLVSAYNFESHAFYERVGRTPIPFELWYARQERDVVTKFLAKRTLSSRLTRYSAQGLRYLQYSLGRGAEDMTLRAVCAALDKFWFVGLTERLDEIAPVLAARMGVTGQLRKDLVTGKDFPRVLELTPELEARINRDNPRDLRLFETWSVRCDERLRSLRAEARSLMPTGRASDVI